MDFKKFKKGNIYIALLGTKNKYVTKKKKNLCNKPPHIYIKANPLSRTLASSKRPRALSKLPKSLRTQ